jgi:hypothetical protein
MSFTRRKFVTTAIGSIASSQVIDRSAVAQIHSESASAAPVNALTVRAVPKDLSDVRGFNYCPASALRNSSNENEPHYRSMWLNYNPAETEFNLDLAKRLNLNQTRAMMSHVAWSTDKQGYRQKIKHFMRSCHDRNIGVMISNTYNEDPGWVKGSKGGAGNSLQI